MIPLGALAASRGPAATSPVKTTTFLGGQQVLDSNGAVKNFTGVPLGTPSDTRTVIVAIGRRVGSGGAVQSVTIAGVTATIDAQPSPHPSAIIARAQVPASAGATGTVVVTLPANEWVVAILGVYHVDGPVSVVASDVQYVASGASAMSRTVASADGGFAVAAAGVGVNTTWTWAGLGEDFDWGYSGYSGSAASAPTTSAPVIVTATPATSGAYGGLAVVTYS